jgi:succinyl-diaminopimelate desuccinylase
VRETENQIRSGEAEVRMKSGVSFNANQEENPMNMGNAVDAYRDEIVDSLCGIIRIQSVREPSLPGKPYGSGPYEALQYALELGAGWGFETKDVDGHAGHVEYRAENETLPIHDSGQAAGDVSAEGNSEKDGSGYEYVAVLAHLDVVPAGLGWTFPPYDAVQEGDRIYGRGASDDKGPAIAALYGLKALRDAGYRPKYSIRVILGCAEETGSEDMDYYFSKEPLPLMAFTPDVGYPAINREKGILRIRITKDNPGMDAGTGFIRRIQGGDAINMVPRQCFATIDTSLLTGEQVRWLEESVTMEADVSASGKVSETGRVSAIRSEEDPKLFVLETLGKSAHGASPEMGINAVLLMTEWLEELYDAGNESNSCPVSDTSETAKGKASGFAEGEARNSFLKYVNDALGAGTDGMGLGIKCQDAESGSLSVNLGSICMDAASLTLAIDIRYPITANGASIADTIRRHAANTNATVLVDRDVAPLHFPEDHPLIGRLSTAYEMHAGKKLDLLSTGGGTYARSMAGRGIGFGGAGAGAHSPDEYVDVEDLMQHARICTQAMYEISRDPSGHGYE